MHRKLYRIDLKHITVQKIGKNKILIRSLSVPGRKVHYIS